MALIRALSGSSGGGGANVQAGYFTINSSGTNTITLDFEPTRVAIYMKYSNYSQINVWDSVNSQNRVMWDNGTNHNVDDAEEQISVSGKNVTFYRFTSSLGGQTAYFFATDSTDNEAL